MGLLFAAGCTSDAVLGVLDGGGGTGGGGVAMPEWVPQAGQWSVVGTNTLADVNPCPGDDCSWSGVAGQAGVLGSWNGGAFATTVGPRGTLLAWGGGGGSGYYGNEVYSYDVEARVWARRSEPVPDPQPTEPFGELQDGSPMSTQINDLLEFHPPTGSLVALAGSSELGVRPVDTGHMFDLAAASWRRTAVLPTSSHLGFSAYDSNRDLFWANTQGGDLYAYAPEDGVGADDRHGTVTNYGHLLSIAIYTVAAIEPRHDVLIVLDVSGERMTAVGLDQVDPVEIDAAGELPGVPGGGFEWAAAHAAFFWYSGTGNDIRRLTPPPPTEDWRTGVWTWATVDVLGGTPPQPRMNPIFGGWRWAPAIASFVIATRADQPVHAFRP